MQTLKFLGRGSAFNTKEGNTSAYYKRDNYLLLIDCGESIFEKIIESNLLEGVNKVDIYITHTHSDHIGSLSSLLFYCFYKKNIVATVHYPAETLYEILNHMGMEDEYQYNYTSDCMTINMPKFIKSIKAIKVNHDNDHMYAYGYLITLDINDEEKNIWYSGDCNQFSFDIWKELKDIDEIYQDTSLADYEGNIHLSLRSLCEYIPEHQRYKVYCMHLDCDELIKGAKKLGFNVAEVQRRI